MTAPGTRVHAAGARAAAAAICALGGATVVVRLPVPPVAATLEEELGLPAPEFRDVAVRPCSVRTRRDGSRELLVGAAALEKALGVTDASSAKLTLAAAAFVQVSGELLLLRRVEALELDSRAYSYRLVLRSADAEVRP